MKNENQINSEVKREEFWYDSRDEVTKIHAVRWDNGSEKKKAIVQIVHGMTEHAMRYDAFAEFLAARDILVVANDHLGHGMTRREDVPYGYFCRRDPATVVVRDVHRLKKLTQERYPGVPIIIVGHSMGSFILRNYMTRYGTGIDGVVLVGTGQQSPFLAGAGAAFVRFLSLFMGQKHVAKQIDAAMSRQFNKKCRPQRTKADWLNSQPEEVDLRQRDGLCGNPFTLNGFWTLFTLVRRACLPEAVKKTPKDLPVLFVSGKEDPVGDYGEGVLRARGLFEDGGMTDVTCRLYEGARHEILLEKQKDEVWNEIFTFVQRFVKAK